jgi:hypothetical protein
MLPSPSPISIVGALPVYNAAHNVGDVIVFNREKFRIRACREVDYSLKVPVWEAEPIQAEPENKAEEKHLLDKLSLVRQETSEKVKKPRKPRAPKAAPLARAGSNLGRTDAAPILPSIKEEEEKPAEEKKKRKRKEEVKEELKEDDNSSVQEIPEEKEKPKKKRARKQKKAEEEGQELTLEEARAYLDSIQKDLALSDNMKQFRASLVPEMRKEKLDEVIDKREIKKSAKKPRKVTPTQDHTALDMLPFDSIPIPYSILHSPKASSDSY